MKKAYLLYLFILFSCGEKKQMNCIQNIEIIGYGLRINVDSIKEKEVFQALLESEDEHHYISIRDFSTVEIDTNTLKSVSKAYSIFRKEVQEGGYIKSQLAIAGSTFNTMKIFFKSPIELDILFKESAKLHANSFPNYQIRIEDNSVSNAVLLGQKYIESAYWECTNQEKQKFQSQQICLEIANSLKLDSNSIEILMKKNINEFINFMEANHPIELLYFYVGYEMEYLRVCHELYNQKNNASIIETYLEEKIAEESELLDFVVDFLSHKSTNHFLVDLQHILELHKGVQK
jgi:hypothetical protein